MGSFSFSLSLRELRCTTSFLQAVLLSFLCTRVSRQETCSFQYGTAVFFSFKKRTCYAKTNCACLTSVTTAEYVYKNVIFGFCFNRYEGLLNDLLKSSLREIIFESTVVNNNRAVAARDKTNTGDCLLSSARTPELKFLFNVCFCHIHSPLF